LLLRITIRADPIWLGYDNGSRCTLHQQLCIPGHIKLQSNFLDRVVKWDKNTPNLYPVRDKAKWVTIDKAIEQMYSCPRASNAKFILERSALESKALLAAPAIEMAYPKFFSHCRKSARQVAPRDAPQAARP
jgi:hypothetical protein